MLTTATHTEPDTTSERVLLMAFALSAKTWQLSCTTGPGHQPRERPVAARHQARLLRSQGVRLTRLSKFPEQLDALRLGDGSPLPSGLRRRVLRV